MKRTSLGLVWTGCSLIGLACGGKVVVDVPGAGGGGGTGSSVPAGSMTTGTFGQGGGSMVTVGPGPITATSTGTGPAAVTATAVVSSASGGNVCDNSGDCATCQTCATNGPCGALWDECVTQPGCSSMLACFNTCNGDQACYDDCYNKFPEAQELYKNLAICVICEACSSDCDGPGSGC